MIVCLLVACLTPQQHASVSQARICSDIFSCCHTDRSCRSNFLPHSVSILTPGRPVPALILYCQTQGREATGVPIFKSWYESTWRNPRCKLDWNPGSAAGEADVLTTRTTRPYGAVALKNTMLSKNILYWHRIMD